MGAPKIVKTEVPARAIEIVEGALRPYTTGAKALAAVGLSALLAEGWELKPPPMAVIQEIAEAREKGEMA